MIYPDFRLCQLIGNALDPGDHYYVEDDKLVDALIRNYGAVIEYLDVTKQAK